jgi:ferritin-like metal-binding protein YciE
MEMNDLKDLYVAQIKDAHSAERQLVEALPKMAKAARFPALSAAIEEHLAVTSRQLERLDRICEGLGISGKGHKCKGMEGLIEEGKEALEAGEDSSTLDAAIILAAQKVEHYEIALYGGLRAYAELLHETKAAKLLDESLEEEKQADATLNEIATQVVNLQAAREEEEAEPIGAAKRER